MNQSLERVVDLLDPALNQIHNMTVEDARRRVLSGKPEAVREIDGSFALVARQDKTVRMARSLDRPMRYFLAKRHEGPALIVADRIDTIYEQLKADGLENQFHPSYTRMVPAHYVVEIHLVGCPDPDPTFTRFFTPQRNALTTDLNEIGAAYISALTGEIIKWLRAIDRDGAREAANVARRNQISPVNHSMPTTAEEGLAPEPIGVCFSGGIDSGAVFLMTYHVMRKLGMNPNRLKAFTLSFGDGPDLQQARAFLDALGLGIFHRNLKNSGRATARERSPRG